MTMLFLLVGALGDFDKPPLSAGGSIEAAGATASSAQSTSGQPNSTEDASAASKAEVQLQID